MRVNRREFLGAVAATVPLGWRLGRRSLAIGPAPTRVVLDLEDHCSLRESVSGYASVLGSRLSWTAPSARQRWDLLIIPAALQLPTPVRDVVATCLRGGGLVILESGAGFASERSFSAHRAALREALAVDIADPVTLRSNSTTRCVPYVDFAWPFPTKVRDFSRVVPIASRAAGEPIAYVGGHVVGIRRRSGRGTLVVLGSPLGPALWAGDAEAQRWLDAVPNANTVREW